MGELVAVLVGAALTLSVAVAVGAAYALWRYAYQPWVVLRRDVAALHQQFTAFRDEFDRTLEQTRRRVGAMSDEELASIERRLRQESRVRASRVGVE